ncbi:MAG: hypothetical protein RIS94_238 [Pseudomonadota bacterium]
MNAKSASEGPKSQAVQEKLGQIARIIARAADLTGEEARAIIWFKYQPLPGWGKTAEQLVEAGHAEAVLEDLKRMAEGVYS